MRGKLSLVCVIKSLSALAFGRSKLCIGFCNLMKKSLCPALFSWSHSSCKVDLFFCWISSQEIMIVLLVLELAQTHCVS